MMRADSPPIVERGRARILIWLGCATAIAAAVLLFLFNPAEHGFYPRCFLKTTTGLDCPGCGGLRATHKLLHGNLKEAFALNPLFVIGLPVAAIFLGCSVAKKFTGWKGPRWIKASTALWIGAALVIAFGILRNLPWEAWVGG